MLWLKNTGMKIVADGGCVVKDPTSSARNRSFARKLLESLSLSLTVLFFTWDLMALACWPIVSYIQKQRQQKLGETI